MRVDKIDYQRTDVLGPGPSAENAVMPDTGLQMAGFLIIRQTRQQRQGGSALSGGRDIIILAFDHLHSGLPDLAEIHWFSIHCEDVSGDLPILKHTLDRGQVKR